MGEGDARGWGGEKRRGRETARGARSAKDARFFKELASSPFFFVSLAGSAVDS